MTLSLGPGLDRSSGYANGYNPREEPVIDLAGYTTGDFQRGASRLTEGLWWVARAIFFINPVPWPSALRVALLRGFGARVGEGVVIRSGVNVTFPWRLGVGDHAWLGEEVVILSLAQVEIESNCCISQRAFLCTGTHDFSVPEFSLRTSAITIKQGSWVAAGAFIGPGVTVGQGSMVTAQSVVTKDVPPGVIVQGNPAVVVKELGGRPI
jgi:putative colanic acid biosynthesis acetyltransferase WcaF